MSSVPAAGAARPAAEAIGIDVDAERRATTGAVLGHHFNAAGAALPSGRVVGTVVEHLRREEERGGYEAAADARAAIDAVYSSAARLIGCSPDEIALFDSASTGLRTVVDALRPARGTRIIASSSTYVSHALHLMSVARERDLDLVIAPTDARRRLDLAALEGLLADGTPTIVSVAHVPTSSGLVEPATEIGALTARYGGTYLLDATQSVGHLRVDVDEIGCDVLVTTGRKFLRGPRGTGFSYVRDRLLATLAPVAPDVRGARWRAAHAWDLDATARRFETWEGPVASRLGLGAAVDEVLARGMDATADWLVAAGERLRRALAEIPGVRVVDPDGSESAIVTFLIDGVEPARAVSELADRAVRVVSVPATHGQWDLGDRGIESVVRASPHVYNDETDLAALVDGIRAIRSGRGAA